MQNICIKFLMVFMLIITISINVKGQAPRINVTFDLKQTYQTIDNFAASDAWACQFVGKWPAQSKNQVADYLFSLDTLKDGSPKGIGLSLWRFNLGAGSSQQGANSDIKDEWRRAESFLNDEGRYDWGLQEGQIWFLKAARDRGVDQFLCFSNSAPVQFTANGKAHADEGKTNLEPSRYADFADYLSKAIKGVEKTTKIHFNYVSPVNEPQWDWNGGQEGCPFTNVEIGGLVKKIDEAFTRDHISSKVVVPEAGSITYLYSAGDKPGKGNQIGDFFKPTTGSYIGDLQHVAPVIASHSYFTTSPDSVAQKLRRRLADSVSGIKKIKYWQSEYCILGDNAGEINGDKRDPGMESALYLARVIHADLTVANASAWQWWTAISPYDYKDGLIYIDKNKTGGNFYTSKMLWAMGNYSRFIRPGAVRLQATAPNNTGKKPLLVAAFRKGKNFTAVIVNPGEDAVLNVNVLHGNIQFTNSYTTTDNKELQAAHIGGRNVVNIERRSVTTITGVIK